MDLSSVQSGKKRLGFLELKTLVPHIALLLYKRQLISVYPISMLYDNIMLLYKVDIWMAYDTILILIDSTINWCKLCTNMLSINVHNVNW